MKSALRFFILALMMVGGFAAGNGWVLMASEQKSNEAAPVAVTGEEAKKEEPAQELVQVPPGREGEMVLELTKRKQSLDAKSRELEEKEKDLKALEAAVNEQMKKLDELRDQLSKQTEAQKKEQAEKISRIVETIEGMSPKTSAQMLAGIEDRLAVEVLGKLSTVRLPKILQAMDSKKAAVLMEQYAGIFKRPVIERPIERKPEPQAAAPRAPAQVKGAGK